MQTQAQTAVAQGPAYYPEMGEQAPERLFHSEFNFAGTYSLCWRLEENKSAGR